jgi:hypothetical protein
MTYRLRSAFYVLMLLLVSAVIVGLYFDRPREDPAGAPAAAAAAEDATYVPQATDGPVTDAKPESVNQA